MAHVRPFDEMDIPGSRGAPDVFKTADRRRRGPERITRLPRRLPRRPVADPTLPSLVYEEDGRITGFIGVMPRRMTMGGRQFHAAVSSQFVVDPRVPGRARRGPAREGVSGWAAGPVDLRRSQRYVATDLGGSGRHDRAAAQPVLDTAAPPGRVRAVVARGSIAAAAAARPLAPVIDALATRMPHSHLYQTRPGVSAVDDLTEQTVLAYLPTFVGRSTLRVEYQERTLRWVLDRAHQRRANDDFRAAVILNDQRIIGCNLAHVDESRTAHVPQIVADPAAIGDVLDHLFYHAAEQGAAAATGRLEPRFLQALSKRLLPAPARPVGPSACAPSGAAARFESGDAVFSQLDGEWSLGFYALRETSWLPLRGFRLQAERKRSSAWVTSA